MKIQYWREDRGLLAVFPDQKYDTAGTLWTCYTSAEGIGGCDPNYLKNCTEVTEEEAHDLKEELITKGYV